MRFHGYFLNSSIAFSLTIRALKSRRLACWYFIFYGYFQEIGDAASYVPIQIYSILSHNAVCKKRRHDPIKNNKTEKMDMG